MKSVQSIDRALEILMMISCTKKGFRIVDIEKNTGLPKSTIHRLLTTLSKHGFIEKATDNLHYIAGPRIVELASIYLNNLELKTEAYPHLYDLSNKTKKIVHMAILQDEEATYIEKIDIVSSMRMYSQIGRRAPLHCTAVGKILLSGLSSKHLKYFLSNMEMQRFTDKTITDAETLTPVINDIRQKKIAFDLQEHETGINCVAAPVYDYLGKIIAAVSVTGMQEAEINEIVPLLNTTVKNISKKFGYNITEG